MGSIVQRHHGEQGCFGNWAGARRDSAGSRRNRDDLKHRVAPPPTPVSHDPLHHRALMAGWHHTVHNLTGDGAHPPPPPTALAGALTQGQVGQGLVGGTAGLGSCAQVPSLTACPKVPARAQLPPAHPTAHGPRPACSPASGAAPTAAALWPGSALPGAPAAAPAAPAGLRGGPAAPLLLPQGTRQGEDPLTTPSPCAGVYSRC